MLRQMSQTDEPSLPYELVAAFEGKDVRVLLKRVLPNFGGVFLRLYCDGDSYQCQFMYPWYMQLPATNANLILRTGSQVDIPRHPQGDMPNASLFPPDKTILVGEGDGSRLVIWSMYVRWYGPEHLTPWTEWPFNWPVGLPGNPQ